MLSHPIEKCGDIGNFSGWNLWCPCEQMVKWSWSFIAVKQCTRRSENDRTLDWPKSENANIGWAWAKTCVLNWRFFLGYLKYHHPPTHTTHTHTHTLGATPVKYESDFKNVIYNYAKVVSRRILHPLLHQQLNASSDIFVTCCDGSC